jgi:hypothetical protein
MMRISNPIAGFVWGGDAFYHRACGRCRDVWAMIISPQIFIRELQKQKCVFEDAAGELHGIAGFRIEEMDRETVFVFVSDEVKIIETEGNERDS